MQPSTAVEDGMPKKSMEEMVQELADREAIRELTAKYCHLVWMHDAEGLTNLFADDGEFKTGDTVAVKGREAILKWYGRLGTSTRPFIHHNVVRLNGDRATGTCELDVRGERDGHRTLGYGTYDDEYVRVDGEWRFQSRWFHPQLTIAVAEA